MAKIECNFWHIINMMQLLLYKAVPCIVLIATHLILISYMYDVELPFMQVKFDCTCKLPRIVKNGTVIRQKKNNAILNFCCLSTHPGKNGQKATDLWGHLFLILV